MGTMVHLTDTFVDNISPLFDPAHPFSDLLKPNRYKVYYGGRGSGKSWTLAEALIRMADVAKIRVLCTRELQTSIKHSVHKLLADTIARLGLDSRFEITQNSIRSHTGSEFIFMGIKFNFQEIKSLESVDITWLEEAQYMSEDSWIVIMPTILRKPGSECWVSFNTGSETDSTYRRWVLKPPISAIVHKVNWNKNPYFTEELISGMERDRLLLDPETFDNVWEGIPLKLTEAVIFRNKFSIREFESPLTADFLHGLDFGFSNDPFAMVRCYVQDQILYIDYECGGYGVELDEYGPHIKTIPTGHNWKIYCDAAQPGNISLLKRQGFNADAVKKYGGSVEDGISHIKSYKDIIIHPRCINTISEFKKYSWKVDRVSGDIQPVPVDKDNHYIDSLRYALNKYILRGKVDWAVLAGK